MIKPTHVIKRKITLQPVSSHALVFSVIALKVNISSQFFQAERRTSPLPKKKKKKSTENKVLTNSVDMSEECGVEVNTGISVSISLVIRV